MWAQGRSTATTLGEAYGRAPHFTPAADERSAGYARHITVVGFYFRTRRCTPIQRWPLIKMLYARGLGLARICRLVASTPAALHRARCEVLNIGNISRLIATLAGPSFVVPTQLARMPRSNSCLNAVGSLWLQREIGRASVLLGPQWKAPFIVPSEERRQLQQWRKIESARCKRVATKTRENVAREAAQRRAAQRAAAAGDAEVVPGDKRRGDPFVPKREITIDDVGGVQPTPSGVGAGDLSRMPPPMPPPPWMAADGAVPPMPPPPVAALPMPAAAPLPPAMAAVPPMLAMPPMPAAAPHPAMPALPPMPGGAGAGGLSQMPPPMPRPPTPVACVLVSAHDRERSARIALRTAAHRATICANCEGTRVVLHRALSDGDATPVVQAAMPPQSCVLAELQRKVAARRAHAQSTSYQKKPCLVCAGTGRPAGRCPNWSRAYAAETSASASSSASGSAAAGSESTSSTSGGAREGKDEGKRTGKRTGKRVKSRGSKDRAWRRSFALDYAFVDSQTKQVSSFMYRYILRESCSQFDSLPLTSLTIFLTPFAERGDLHGCVAPV